ncbi:hypothetical protein [Aureimonas sp. AU40]|uniref:hypothetical protein n=1 Tax=Aureimonas sp. AU40 TaxID=1637747 RepID=UPI0007854F0B|nr:hypothetical protein [Aureimonas sp. AU40]
MGDKAGLGANKRHSRMARWCARASREDVAFHLGRRPESQIGFEEASGRDDRQGRAWNAVGVFAGLFARRKVRRILSTPLGSLRTAVRARRNRLNST